MKTLKMIFILIPALLWLAFVLWVAWNHPFYFFIGCVVIGAIKEAIEKRKAKAGN